MIVLTPQMLHHNRSLICFVRKLWVSVRVYHNKHSYIKSVNYWGSKARPVPSPGNKFNQTQLALFKCTFHWSVHYQRTKPFSSSDQDQKIWNDNNSSDNKSNQTLPALFKCTLHWSVNYRGTKPTPTADQTPRAMTKKLSLLYTPMFTARTIYLKLN